MLRSTNGKSTTVMVPQAAEYNENFNWKKVLEFQGFSGVAFIAGKTCLIRSYDGKEQYKVYLDKMTRTEALVLREVNGSPAWKKDEFGDIPSGNITLTFRPKHVKPRVWEDLYDLSYDETVYEIKKANAVPVKTADYEEEKRLEQEIANCPSCGGKMVVVYWYHRFCGLCEKSVLV